MSEKIKGLTFFQRSVFKPSPVPMKHLFVDTKTKNEIYCISKSENDFSGNGSFYFTF